MTDAQIFDQGYRTYSGPRTGLRGALRSLVIASLRATLGLGRKARHKIIPILTIAISYLPAIVILGIVVLLGEVTADEANYYGYYDGVISIAVVLMVAFMVPQLLCTDRRTGLLGVYLASPLNRPTYLLGKAITAVILLLTVTLGPPLIVLLGYSLQGVGPDGFTNWVETFAKIILSSLVLGIFLTSIGLAISATTDRWGTATATIIGVLIASGIVTGLLVEESDLSPAIRLFSLVSLPLQLIHRIHNDEGFWTYSENPTWSLWLAFFGWVLASLAFVWSRYRTLLVRR